MINSKVLLSYILNWFFFSVIVAVTFLIGRDARRRGLSWPATILWILVSIFLFLLAWACTSSSEDDRRVG